MKGTRAFETRDSKASFKNLRFMRFAKKYFVYGRLLALFFECSHY